QTPHARWLSVAASAHARPGAGGTALAGGGGRHALAAERRRGGRRLPPARGRPRPRRRDLARAQTPHRDPPPPGQRRPQRLELDPRRLAPPRPAPARRLSTGTMADPCCSFHRHIPTLLSPRPLPKALGRGVQFNRELLIAPTWAVSET